MDAVAEIKAKLDLVEYIGRVTRLQKAGRNFRGLCPFHTEKTPSFYVFPDRGSWRCFGSCGEGGDLFSFAQKRENIDFRTVLRQLAQEAGVQLSAESAQRRSRQEQLSGIMSAAVDFYQRNLRDADGADARDYLAVKRGLKPAIIEAFRLGWAPDDWRPLRDYLGGRGYDERDVLAAGLLVESESGGQPYDRFRGRLIIPIANERGEYVAMGGRGLHSEEPKYLNSPQTEIFDKGRTLFGLDLAASAIRESGTAVVVEGYMDVIGPSQAGFKNVVATMGTSLTEHHAALLRRHARRIVLAMDPDAAGLAAAERAGGLFFALDSPQAMARSARSAESLLASSELELRVAPLPPGKDPDEVARDDPEAWRGAIGHALPFAEFLLTRLMGPTTPESPVEARRIVDRLKPVLLEVRDPVERGVYVQRVARHLGVPESAVMDRIKQGLHAGRPGAPRPAVASAGEEVGPDQVLLAFLLRSPRLRADMRGLPASLFTNAIDREVFLRWLQGEESPLPPEDPLGDHLRRLEGLRLPALGHEDVRRAVQAKIRDILRERAIQHQAAITEQVAEAERTIGANEVERIANAAWLSAAPGDPVAELAEAVMEQMELGLSIHRREGPAS